MSPFAHCVSNVRCGAILCDGRGDTAPILALAVHTLLSPSISMAVVPQDAVDGGETERQSFSRYCLQVEIVIVSNGAEGGSSSKGKGMRKMGMKKMERVFYSKGIEMMDAYSSASVIILLVILLASES